MSTADQSKKPLNKKLPLDLAKPGSSDVDHRWVIDVLEDLSTYAEQCCSSAMHHELKSTAHNVRRLILIEMASAKK